MVPPASRRIPRVLRYSGFGSLPSVFAYEAFTPFGGTFQCSSADFLTAFCRSTTPESMLPGLGSFHFARRYFGNRCLFLFLRVLRCFSSPGSRLQGYSFTLRQPSFSRLGFPIRISADRCLLATPRSFSQLAASFFGDWCLGIHPVLFFA